MKDMKDMKEQKVTFLYRKLFTPNLNIFLYIQVTILSFISFISDKDDVRKYVISAS